MHSKYINHITDGKGGERFELRQTPSLADPGGYLEALAYLASVSQVTRRYEALASQITRSNQGIDSAKAGIFRWVEEISGDFLMQSKREQEIVDEANKENANLPKHFTELLLEVV